MKKIAVIFCLAAAALAIVFACGTGSAPVQAGTEYLRIHIRANSDKEADQSVKYAVRDAVVAYLAPTVAECGTKAAAMSAVAARLDAVESVATRVLCENGFFYGARARVCEEAFPTRVYEGVTLPAGVYDALILELGSGAGDNWWCVVYPPLCFTGGSVNVVYRSKIAEIIQKFFGK